MKLAFLPIFLMGTAIGSFLSVCAWRLNPNKSKKKGILFGRSYCDYCKRKITFWENIPLLSFILLGGRCRTCKKKIPIRYFFVELLTGTVFLLAAYPWLKQSLFQLSWEEIVLLFISLTISALLTFVFLYDLYYQLIPDSSVISLSILALFFLWVDNNFDLLSILISVLSGSGFLLLLHLITRGKGMGLGDVKLAIFMGILLDWQKLILAFYLAFLTGAIVGVILILSKKKKFGQKIAFGPFLVTGTFLAWLYGDQLIMTVKKLFYL